MKKIHLILTAILLCGLLTKAQIPTNGLLGWFPFNGNAHDESGNTFDGTVKGAALTTDRFGISNSAYLFNGSSSYISIPKELFNSSTIGSISLWIEISDVSPRNTIFNVGDSTAIVSVNANVYGLVIYPTSDPTNSRNFVHQIDTRKCGGENLWGSDHSYTFQAGVWNHIVLISDGTKTRYFRNGIEAPTLYTNNILPTGQWINSLCPSVNYFWLGKSKRTTENFFFNGKIDDVGIWNRVLTDDEVTQLYNTGICYQNVTVTDVLIINANITGFNPITYLNTIKIFPNPTKDKINIDFGNNYSTLNGYSLKIVNSISQTVFTTSVTQQNVSVNLSSWTGNGTYFVYLIDNYGNTIDVKKIILQ